MASKALIVTEIMREIGKSSPLVSTRIETLVGDITVDLLTQSNGRFKKLEDFEEISITGDGATTEYLLPATFNTAKKTFYQENDDGEFVAECTCTSKQNIMRRHAEGRYVGPRICYIRREAGTGYYLVLATAATEDTTYIFEYYRIATADDTDLIDNPDIVKEGVRGGLAEFLGSQALYHKEIYLRMRQGFKPKPEKTNPRMTLMPSRKLARHNRGMRNIGEGG